eukprot:TRINITY_DN66633_c7_g2_i1.p1 TRINITY_DN66633_c7_g2~~TRINITY_DN66633_c7_g2_i1.p1  ORF type:complete len:437 (+),score=26.45 TRINITY_DN66633_c7_g2_i1:55-1365(+)
MRSHVLCLALAYFTNPWTRTVVSGLYPSMLADPTTALDGPTMGTLAACSTAVYMVSKFVWTFLASRFDGRRLFPVLLIALTLTVAAVPAVSSSLVGLFMVQFVSRFIQSGCWPGLTDIVSHSVPADELGITWGAMSTASRTGAAFSGVAIGMILHTTKSWRKTAWYMCAISIAIQFFVLPFVSTIRYTNADPKQTTKAAGKQPTKQTKKAASKSNTTTSVLPHHKAKLQTMSSLSIMGYTFATKMSFLQILVGVFCSPLFGESLTGMYYTNHFNMPRSIAAALASATPIGAAFAAITGGMLFDNLSRKNRGRLIAANVGITTLAQLLLCSLPPDAHPALIAVLSSIIGMISFTYYVPINEFALQFAGADKASVVTTLYDTVCYMGVIVMEFAIPRVAAIYGWYVYGWFLFACAVLAFCTASLAQYTYWKEAKQHEE